VSWVNSIFDWVNINPSIALLVIFIIACVESLLLIGLFVPGTALMLMFGTLVATGYLPMWAAILSAFSGAFVGDFLSFWLGRYYRDSLRTLYPLCNHPDKLQVGVLYFQKHGGKSVFIARFIGPLRPVVPAVAGMLNMHPVRFMLFNATSAVIWALLFLFPGWFTVNWFL